MFYCVGFIHFPHIIFILQSPFGKRASSLQTNPVDGRIHFVIFYKKIIKQFLKNFRKKYFKIKQFKNNFKLENNFKLLITKDIS